MRQPTDAPGRSEGCIDTPFIAGEQRTTTAGIQCGRVRSGERLALRGRVVAEALGGLPGVGLEGLWVGVHAVGDRAVNVEALPAALVEAETDAQGEFTLLVSGTTEILLAVRTEAGGRLLAARRLTPSAVGEGELQLLVPLDDALRRELEL